MSRYSSQVADRSTEESHCAWLKRQGWVCLAGAAQSNHIGSDEEARDKKGRHCRDPYPAMASRYADKSFCALALEAAKNALEDARLPKKEIDNVVYSINRYLETAAPLEFSHQSRDSTLLIETYSLGAL